MAELDKNETLQRFGLHVKNLRKTKSMTQIEVSSAMQRDQQSLQRVESGNINPSLIYLIELADALDVTICELTTFD